LTVLAALSEYQDLIP